jgi:hypothetical protein
MKRRNRKLLLLFAAIICIAAQRMYCQETPDKILQVFLHGKSTEQVEKSYWYIYQNQSKFSDLVFSELAKYQDKINNVDVPDRLLYLAAIIRDERYIIPLSKLINNPNYSEDACIYYCPIVLALKYYACFSTYKVPTDFNRKLTAVNDLYSDIDNLRNLKVHKQKITDFIHGPDDSANVEIGKKTFKSLFALAGPDNKNEQTRFIASVGIAAKVTDDTYLPELYWLACTEMMDASCEYRCFIYQALDKAEKYRFNKLNKIRNRP